MDKPHSCGWMRTGAWPNELRAGEVLVEPVDGDSPHTVPRGLIHDWIGAVFVPKAKLDDVMGVLGDYEHYKDFYRPMVVKARLLEQTPDHQKLTLLMVQKAFSVTGAVETDNEIQIARLGAGRAYSLSTSVRVQEIADYGKPSEHALPEDHGPGYVWRTFNVTRLEQRDDGVYIEMEMIGHEPRHPGVVTLADPAAGGTPASKHRTGDASGHAGRREPRDQSSLVENPDPGASRGAPMTKGHCARESRPIGSSQS